MKPSMMRGARNATINEQEDDEASIEAQIQRELEALSPMGENDLVDAIDDDSDLSRSEEEEPPPNGSIPESVAQYLERVKSRARGAEEALEECDAILKTAQKEADDVEEFAYKSKQLNEIAFQLGEDPEELRDRVIQELEEEERKDHETHKEEGSKVNDLALVPTLNEDNGSLVPYTEIDHFEWQLNEKVRALEGVLEERVAIEMRDLEETGRVMATLDQNAERHRQQMQQENDEEQRRVTQERLVEQSRMEEELAEETRQTEAELRQYQQNIDELSRRTALEKEAFEQQWGKEVQRQGVKKQKAATTIQAAFRSYRVRKPYRNKIKLIRDGLKERRENERQIEIIAMRKKEEQKKRKEKLDKMKKEEEERKKQEEEEKRKEEERKEIERLTKLQQKKEKEEKERLEKERLKKDEEEARRKEELDRKSEEILKKIMPDRQKGRQGEIEGPSDETVVPVDSCPVSVGSPKDGAIRGSEIKSSVEAVGSEEVTSGETVFITENSFSIEGSTKSTQPTSKLGQRDAPEGQSGGKSSEQTNVPSGGNGSERTNVPSGGNGSERTNVPSGGESMGDQATNKPCEQTSTHLPLSAQEPGSVQRSTDKAGLVIQDQRELGEERRESGQRQNPNIDDRTSGSVPHSASSNLQSSQSTPTNLGSAVNSSASPNTSISDIAVKGQTLDGKDADRAYKENIDQTKPAPQISNNRTQRERNDGRLEMEAVPVEKQELLEHRPLETDLEQRRLKWIQDCIPLTKLTSRAKLDSTAGRARRQLRRPASAKKSPALTDVQITSASPPDTPLAQVATVQLKDLPGCSLSSLVKCQRLRTLTLHDCGVTALESLDASPDVLWIDVSRNKIESLLCRDRPKLASVDASWNVIASAQGLEGCHKLRRLNLSHNKISRINGLENLLSLTHLDLGHNQLVNVSGLTCLVHLQDLCLTANHLSNVRGLDQCPLLQRLDLSSNSLTQVPDLSNNVLLRSLTLSGNSLSSLGSLDAMWLPLLQRLDVSQNGLTELVPLNSFLLLDHVSLCNNFISDIECLIPGLDGCHQLRRLDIQGNAVTEESDCRDAIIQTLPGLCQLDRDHLTPGVRGHKPDVMAPPRSSFEVMCRSQAEAQDALLMRQEAEVGSVLRQASGDVSVLRAELEARHLEEIYDQAVDHRYAHEYGETSPARVLPDKPSEQKTGTKTEADSLMPQAEIRSKAQATLSTTAPQPHSKLAATNPSPKDSVVSNDKQHAEGKESVIGQNPAAPGSKVNAQSVSRALRKELNAGGTSIADRAAVVIQSLWRGHSVRHQIELGTKQWLAALRIQATWRGHRVRRRLREVKRSLEEEVKEPGSIGGHGQSDPGEFEEYGEVDIDSFDFNEDILEKGWSTPSETPTLHSKYAPLPPTSQQSVPRGNAYSTFTHKTPSSSAPMPYPPSTTKPLSSPEKLQPRPLRQAWRGADSPLQAGRGADLPLHLQTEDRSKGHYGTGSLREGQSPPEGQRGVVGSGGLGGGGLVMRKPPLPPTTPSSLGSTEILSEGTPRTQRTHRQEVLSEEWGFKDSVTADLMMKRAKKMAKGKKKKLDPIQRYQQMKKAQDASTPTSVQTASKKGVQRKDYFQAREEEEEKKVRGRVEESKHKQHRTFDWVHAQVNSYESSDSRLGGYGAGAGPGTGAMAGGTGTQRGNRYSNSEPNLPAMSPDVMQGSRISLVSPNGLEVQSVESASIVGYSARGRSHSFSSPEAAERVQFPPIKTNSAPSSHTKQRMASQGGRPGRGKNGR